MAKSRKTIRGKRNRRNKTVRGGENTSKKSSPKPDDDDYDLPPILPVRWYVPRKKSPSPKLKSTPNSPNTPKTDLERHMEDKHKKQLQAINEHNKQFNLLSIKTRNEIKHDIFIAENEKYLSEILVLAGVPRREFNKFIEIPENQNSDAIIAFLTSKIDNDKKKKDKTSRKEKIISLINSDDFDAVMSDIRTDSEKDWFPSPIKLTNKKD